VTPYYFLSPIFLLFLGKIDVVATDHAPHTEQEKDNIYTKAPSGGPLVQHSLLAMLELANQKYFSREDVIKWMCHNPAELFQIENRGFIKEGYCADLVLIDPNEKTIVTKNSLLYKCGWSPFEGTTFNNKIVATFVNGNKVYENGRIIEGKAGEKLKFNRRK
jgi:dihydroorotase